MSKPVAHMVPVEVLQDDMVGFEARLPFPVHDLYGKTAFTERVLFGEIWLADCSKRRVWRAGTVQDGKLYLDQTAGEKFLHNRKHSRQPRVPTLVPCGTYKVWLDAWVRRGDPAYTADPQFTNDPVNGDGGLWSAPNPSACKHWQEVKITSPAKTGAPCRIRVRSRRFHWFFRLSRLLDVLDVLLLAHEKQIQKVNEVRLCADYMRDFLGVLWDSPSNGWDIMKDGDRRESFSGMNRVLANVKVRTENFIHYGQCDGHESPLPERKHINNVAHLVWALIHQEDFDREVALHDPILAEEHRFLLGRLNAVFNRVPRILVSVVEKSKLEMVAKAESFAYGRKFAEEFTFPFFNARLRSAGHTPAFLPEKPASTARILHSARRYSISNLNAGSIFLVKEKLDVAKLLLLIEQEDELWAVGGKGNGMVELSTQWVNKFTAAGNLLKTEKWDHVRKRYLTDFADVNKDFLKLRNDIELIREQLEAKPQKILDRLKGSNPAPCYGVQIFEIYVKWVWAAAAWSKFHEVADKKADERLFNGIDAGIKSIDFLGTTLQFLGLHKVLQWKGASMERLKGLEKFGKGLNAVADFGSAVLYSYDIFVTGTYGDELLKKYSPEDACRMYGWHLITWGGRWVVAVGSTGSLFSKLPFWAGLQFIGYMGQLIGEAGESWTSFGAGEQEHFHKANLELNARASVASSAAEVRGWKAAFYDPSDREDMANYMARFKWLPIDAELYKARLGEAAD